MPMLVLATGTPSRLATTVPASCVPEGITDGSAVSVTEPVPWAGTVTWSADIGQRAVRGGVPGSGCVPEARREVQRDGVVPVVRVGHRALDLRRIGVGPRQEAEVGRAGGVDVSERRRHVDPAGADLVRREVVEALRRAHQRVLELRRRVQSGWLLGQEGGRAGHVRRGHRRTAHRLVVTRAVDAVRPRCGEDVDAGRDEVGLERRVAEARSHAGEVGELVRARRRRRRSAPRRRRRAALTPRDDAVVARRDHEQRAGLVAEACRRPGPSGRCRRWARAAEAHADDVGAGRRPTPCRR